MTSISVCADEEKQLEEEPDWGIATDDNNSHLTILEGEQPQFGCDMAVILHLGACSHRVSSCATPMPNERVVQEHYTKCLGVSHLANLIAETGLGRSVKDREWHRILKVTCMLWSSAIPASRWCHLLRHKRSKAINSHSGVGLGAERKCKVDSCKATHMTTWNKRYDSQANSCIIDGESMSHTVCTVEIGGYLSWWWAR